VPPSVFDPAKTTRAFRVALPDLSASLFPVIAERMLRSAPSASLEWIQRDSQILFSVAEGNVDLALVPSSITLPDKIHYAEVTAFKWASFVRQDHPAIAQWNEAEWAKWPHVAVRMGTNVTSPIDVATTNAQAKRKIATWVPHFSAVAPLLSNSNLIATLPILVMLDYINRYQLQVLKAPIDLEPMSHRLIWSKRLGNEPASKWLREQFQFALEEATNAANLIEPD
jgi:DNA-binding transcriptional LysR family regulator